MSALAFFVMAISAVEFGAIPNDGKDDTAAIQAAIDSVGCVEFPAGNYNFDSLEIRRNNCVLRGQPGAVLTRVANAESAWAINFRQGYNGLLIEGLEIDGKESEQPNRYSALIRTTRNDRVEIRRCIVRRGGDRAVDIRGGEQIFIQDCRFFDCGLENASGNGGNAISVDRHGSNRPKHVLISGNYFTRFGDSAIGCPSCDEVVIANNICIGIPGGGMDTESGISVNSSKNCTIYGNIVRDCKAGGLFVSDRHESEIFNVTICGNTLINSRVFALFSKRESRNIVFSGNVLEDSMIGVMGDFGENLVVSGNMISGEPNAIKMTGKGHANHVIVANLLKGGIVRQQFVQDGLLENNREPE